LATGLTNAGYVTRTREDVTDLAAKEFGADEDQFRWCRVILARYQMVHGYGHFRKVESFAAKDCFTLRRRWRLIGR